jgi:hypothetical protein
MVAPVPTQTSKLPRRKLSCPCHRSIPNSCRLILLQTLLHSQSRQPLWNQANPNSFAKTVGVPRFSFQPPTTHYPPLTTHSLLTTFRMNTCKSVSKQSTLTIFRMNTYAKQGEGGPYSEGPSGRKYCVPFTGSCRRRSNCWRSALRSTKSISEVLITRRSEAA